MSPITSPDVKPSQNPEINNTVQDLDINMEDFKGISSETFSLHQDLNKENGINESYTPEFIKTDGTYKDTIKILFTFTYGA